MSDPLEPLSKDAELSEIRIYKSTQEIAGLAYDMSRIDRMLDPESYLRNEPATSEVQA